MKNLFYHISAQLKTRDIFLLGLIMLSGFLVRVIDIDQPFVDRWSYRQSDVAMVARNFYQLSYNILWPRIDYGGAQPGYVGMEFPTVPFIAGTFYGLVGEHEAIGRAVSLMFFLLSIPPLFFLVETVAGRQAAFFAICLYSLMPLTIFCGRSFTSDMAANSLSIWAVWLFADWMRAQSRGRMIAATLATAAAILTKAPYVLLGFPMAYLALKNYGTRAFVKKELWLFAALVISPSIFWYLHAIAITRGYYPHVAFLGHPDYFMVLLPIPKYIQIIMSLLSWLTPAVVAAAFVGITRLRQKAGCRLFPWWCAGMVSLIIFASEDNYRQSWYQLPVTAPVAALAGIGAEFIRSRVRQISSSGRLAAALMVAILSLAAYQSYLFVRYYYAPVAEPLRAAGTTVDWLLPRNALILYASWGDPTAVYYSRRHGWLFYEDLVAPTDSAKALAMLEMRRTQGASYFVMTQLEDELRSPPYSSFWRYLETHFAKICSTPQFTIFDLGADVSGEARRQRKIGFVRGDLCRVDLVTGAGRTNAAENSKKRCGRFVPRRRATSLPSFNYAGARSR